MATKIWYPELGDRVALLDGRKGAMSAEPPSLGVDSDTWVATVRVLGRDVFDVRVAYSSIREQWEEQE